jgi:GT2 family glycosyltransferase
MTEIQNNRSEPRTLVSFIISTHNRRDVLMATLDRIGALGLAEPSYEIHVIDNASSDGTADAVAACESVYLYRQAENLGSCAKNIAIPHAKGEFIVFLDDDSYPEPGSIERMIRHFEENPHLGAANFTVTLTDGSQECSAFPNVFIGCGVGLRRAAIDEVGGLPDDFFMQAEEYDLSLRLLNAGWEVSTFDDLHVTHLKSPVARSSDRTMRLDVRNNLMLIARYFPDRLAVPFCTDWLARYWMIASAKGQRRAFIYGMLQGAFRSLGRERTPVSDAVFEQFVRVEQLQTGMWKARNDFRAGTVLFIDLGKNILPYWIAATACGLRIAAIADNRLAGRRYRGTRIVSDEDARKMAFDIAIVSNSSPVHARNRAATWQSIDARPVVNLLAATFIPQSMQSISAAA